METAVKRKRTHGRKDNVERNMYFENYLNSVAKDKKKIQPKPPQGYISRGNVEKEFNFSQLDFENLKNSAIISSKRGQTGLFFPVNTVRELDSANLSRIPKDWIAEQTILRSYRKVDLPHGFPMDFRTFGRYGKPKGRAGKASHFYSQAFLMEQFNLKVLDETETFFLAKSVPFSVEAEPVMCLRLTKPTTLVSLGYFGVLATKILATMQGKEFPTEPLLTNDQAPASPDLMEMFGFTPDNSPGKFSLPLVESPESFSVRMIATPHSPASSGVTLHSRASSVATLHSPASSVATLHSRASSDQDTTEVQTHEPRSLTSIQWTGSTRVTMIPSPGPKTLSPVPSNGPLHTPVPKPVTKNLSETTSMLELVPVSEMRKNPLKKVYIPPFLD